MEVLRLVVRSVLEGSTSTTRAHSSLLRPISFVESHHIASPALAAATVRLEVVWWGAVQRRGTPRALMSSLGCSPPSMLVGVRAVGSAPGTAATATTTGGACWNIESTVTYCLGSSMVRAPVMNRGSPGFEYWSSHFKYFNSAGVYASRYT